ncbi:ribosome small subunit-dependent GTPase A [Canibacter zhuwentaonis]|uniref:ribosome small subunit-dependent GTPase A n=1 Tax=Canibacter zhuwentaonis TaxID=2837491 RepID=UPI003510859F
MPAWLDDSADRYEHYSERVRIRPNPKANRPRTKTRPAHKNAVTGMVTGVDRGRYTVILEADTPASRTVVCARARELAKTAIVIGDSVQVVGELSGATGSLGRIVRVNPRRTLLRRSADDSDRVERVMVANATQLLVLTAAANPAPRVGLVDRSLVAAYDAGIIPMLCVTKTDLADPKGFLRHFEGLDLEIFTTTKTDWQLDRLRAKLAGNTTVFIGHSGVGKSTLINELVPEASRATGRVNTVTGRGRHTSSSSVAFQCDFGADTGWVIDTPGVRSFGLGHVSESAIINSFDGLSEITADCPKGCSHSAVANGCELNSPETLAVLSSAQLQRLKSLRNLLSSSSAVI